MTKPLTVVAHTFAKPGKEELVRRELLHLVSETRKEAGCINYDLHVSPESPGHFFFYENWASRSHLDAHAQSAHILALRAKADELFARPTEITLYEMLSTQQK